MVPITATPLLIGFFLCAEPPEIIPTTKKIIPIQFSQPNNGTKPTKTNMNPKIAKIRLANFFLPEIGIFVNYYTTIPIIKQRYFEV